MYMNFINLFSSLNFWNQFIFTNFISVFFHLKTHIKQMFTLSLKTPILQLNGSFDQKLELRLPASFFDQYKNEKSKGQG